MKTEEINIRDPYILPYDNKYYLFGTRSKTCWGPADGFDCYISSNLTEWEGPVEAFHKPEGFFATEKFWAPECFCYQGKFYIFATFASENIKTCMYILKADEPQGPYTVYSEQVTPEGWACIDGTMYIDQETPYLVFSRTFEDIPNGEFWYVELTDDLKKAKGEPQFLFSGTDAPWVKPIPFAKSDLGIDGDVYLTDAPCMIRMADGGLGMVWSAWGEKGYCVGLSLSGSGGLNGPWQQLEQPIYPENGGHGMFFETKEGELLFVMHHPNIHFKEKPIFRRAVISDNTIEIL